LTAPCRTEAESHHNLVAYRDRITLSYFPNFAQSRGSAAPKDAAAAAKA
jgi:hypothetical protein